MKALNKTILLFVTTALAGVLFSCSPNKSNGCLSIGQTQRNGDFLETIVRLDYVNDYVSDKNRTTIELEFVLHSYHGSIVSLFNGYRATFDGNTSNGSVSAVTKYPSSIAPGDDETIVMKMTCFKDWKTAQISYSYYSDQTVQYSFSIKSSDYPSGINNCYATLKNGESVDTIDGKATIKIQSFEETTIGSAGLDVNQENMKLVYTIQNNTDTEIYTALNTYLGYVVRFDDKDESIGRVSNSTPSSTNSNSIYANQIVQIQLIITAKKNWNKMAIMYCSSTFAFNFNLLHSDYPNISSI